MATGLAVLSMAQTPGMAARPRSILDPVPMPAQVQFVPGMMPGIDQSSLLGNMQTDAATNTIYYQGKPDPFAKAHEVGHLLDHQVLSDGDRAFFQKLMHAPAGEWRAGTGLEGLKSPSEWFADYYASSILNVDPRHENQAAYASIGPKRLRRFEAAIGRLGKRHGLQPYTPG